MQFRSEITGRRMTANMWEFRAWDFPYRVGDTYNPESGNSYYVLAMGTPRKEGNGHTSVLVLVEALSQ